MKSGVSFVIPVHNGARWIQQVLAAIADQADDRPMEIIVVDDASRDDSVERVRSWRPPCPLRIIAGAGKGAAAALNTGVRTAVHPIVCQVDQDVILRRGWMQSLVACLDDPSVAAVQGYYTYDRGATLLARVMNRDLEQRYAAIAGDETTHVCTGNAAYRASALVEVGLFDETLGYGYDNDMSYRLAAAGYRLRLCRDARSVHRWREGIPGYLVQQYGFGYGRLDLVFRHRGRFRGDSVSPAAMMVHAPLMAAAVGGLLAAGVLAAVGGPASVLTWFSLLIVAGLVGERSAAAVAAARRFGDLTPLAFPIVHLARDLVWVAAIAMWLARRFGRRPTAPAHSMRGRRAACLSMIASTGFAPHAPRELGRVGLSRGPFRVLCVIPAFNEAANLTTVVDELSERRPDVDVVVVDDGSTDGTLGLLSRLEVRWLRFPERLGVGSAVRAALRYADRSGYDVAVRMDGDGQHRAEDLQRLLGPILESRADVVLGSRYAGARPGRVSMTSLTQRFLAVCLSSLTRSRITDPTSGFYALGPRAIRLLAEHHPSGYAEAELRLFLSRNQLEVIEAPVGERSRLSGRTSLTARRMAGAAARVVLAMAIVPWRRRMVETSGD
jgi:glycosyltransferase involved in cell wall biosynthesis